MQVTVMGAGIAGLACAVELAERGADVEVVDRGEKLGAASCSWYAGGMLAPWCELESAEPLIAKLGAESLSWWRERLPSTALNGSLVVAHGRDTGELANFSRRTEQFEWLDGEALARLEPDLGGRFNKALFFKDEGHLDPRAALETLVRRLEELKVPIRFGVTLAVAPACWGAPTTQRQVVDCTGLAARDVLLPQGGPQSHRKRQENGRDCRNGPSPPRQELPRPVPLAFRSR